MIMRRLGIAALLSLPPLAGSVAFPDGAPFTMPAEEGCVSCHFGQAVEELDAAALLPGLPAAVRPGGSYHLEIDAGALKAGLFGMMAILEGGGGLYPLDTTLEGNEDARRLRSTGATPEPRWRLRVDAPNGDLWDSRLILWLNAADGDGSPFGDRIYRLILPLADEKATEAGQHEK